MNSDCFHILRYHRLVMGKQYVYCEVETEFFYCNRMKSDSGSGAGPGFVGPEVHKIFGATFIKKSCKSKTTNLGTKANICLGPPQGPFKLKHHQLHGKSSRVPDICRWSLAGEAPFQFQGCPLEIYSIQSGIGTGLHPSTSISPFQHHSTKATNTLINLIFVVPCIMLYIGEISPTRCNNCVFYSQWLYSTCFG